MSHHKKIYPWLVLLFACLVIVVLAAVAADPPKAKVDPKPATTDPQKTVKPMEPPKNTKPVETGKAVKAPEPAKKPATAPAKVDAKPAIKRPVEFVNPFIGTDGHGHTYPGATVPFGMVQLSPNGGKRGWDYCSGYHYSDSLLVGFSHTQLSGTGCEDLGDFLFLPLLGLPKPDVQTKLPYKHKDEHAFPGYYWITLPSQYMTVELTTTKRAGFHRYTFPKCESSCIVIDGGYGQGDTPLESSFKIEGPKQISGRRLSSGWAWEQDLYFYAEFSKPFTSAKFVKEGAWSNTKSDVKGKTAKAMLLFKTAANEKIMVKVGISAVSAENAKKNLDFEIPNWAFDSIRVASYEAWDKELSKIKVSGSSSANRETFYTALYHTMCAPTLFSDVNGQYRGGDGKVHTTSGFENYSTFSLWDTYRAEHPLFTMMHPDRVPQMINAMINFQSEYGYLPVWPLQGYETQCMIGYHSIPVITDAYLKGIKGFDINRAYEAMKVSALANHKGLEYYNLARPESIEQKLVQLHAKDIDSKFDYSTTLRGTNGNYLQGYSSSVSGEKIDYHSAYPYVKRALLVRSTTGKMTIEWQTESLPTDYRAPYATFMWLAGRSVSKGSHLFDLYVNDQKWFTYSTGRDTSDKVCQLKHTNSAELFFVPTVKDVFDDQFGNMFLRIPTALLKPGEPVSLKVIGEKGDSYDWYMTFEYANSSGNRVEQQYAFAREHSTNYQFAQLMIEHTSEPIPAVVSIDGKELKQLNLQPGLNVVDIPIAIEDSAKTVQLSVLSGGATWEMPCTVKPIRPLEYVPADKERESVSKTLEYAFDDWCIARIAKELGKTDEYKLFTKRSEYWKNLYDASSGFMRGKNYDGSWVTPFNPRNSTSLQPEYTEGNSWQWTWSVQHDIPGLIQTMGGKIATSIKLDSLFGQSSDLTGTGSPPDVSGLIGMYAHGNEPSHHVSYLYDFVDQPWKTQEIVRRIMREFYSNKPDGLCGNEDCGQMSAWFVLSALGFYPVNPADGSYQLGSPLFDKIEMKLGSGKTFTVDVKNGSEKNIYVKSVTLNGKPLTIPMITHRDLLDGATLSFEMDANPHPECYSRSLPIKKIESHTEPGER